MIYLDGKVYKYLNISANVVIILSCEKNIILYLGKKERLLCCPCIYILSRKEYFYIINLDFE